MSDQEETTEQRREVLIRLLAVGASRRQILESPEVKAWGVTPRYVERLTVDARAIMRASAAASRQDNMALAIQRHEQLYRIAVGRNDLRAACTVLWQLCRIQGLDQQFTVADLEAVLKLEQLLVGRPTANVEVQAQRVDIRRDPRAALRALAGGRALPVVEVEAG